MLPNKWDNYAENWIDQCSPYELKGLYSELLEYINEIKAKQVLLKFAKYTNDTARTTQLTDEVTALQNKYTELHKIIIHLRKNGKLKCGWEK